MYHSFLIVGKNLVGFYESDIYSRKSLRYDKKNVIKYKMQAVLKKGKRFPSCRVETRNEKCYDVGKYKKPEKKGERKEIFMSDYPQTNQQTGWGTPMPWEEFAFYHAGQLQQFELTDRNQLAEEAKHQRAMQRDEHRAALKWEEAKNKEKCREKTKQIGCTENGICLYILNGENQILRTALLFRFKMLKLQRFRREGENEHLWQAILLTGQDEIFTPLYSEDILKSISKLQVTSFAGLDETVTASDKSMAWRWLQKQLILLFDVTKETVIPSLPGWFLKSGVWNFWTWDANVDLFASSDIRRFVANSIRPQSISEIFEEISDIADRIDNIKSFSVILIFRFLALFSRLVVSCPPAMGLVFVGKGATELEGLVSTMKRNDGNSIVNLDTDRIGVIRNYVYSLQDSPAFFVSSNSHIKSTRNRLFEVLSWLDTGFLEGKKITFPFVFCVSQLSKDYLVDGMVIIHLDEVQFSEAFSTFAKLQSVLTERITNSGEHWITQFRKEYGKLEKKLPIKERKTILHLAQAIVSTVSAMLDIGDGDEDLDVEERKLQEIFAAGIDEIRNQISSDAQPILESFRVGVIKMIDSGKIFVVDVKKTTTKEVPLIYFDSGYYFFTNDTLKYICEENGLDSRAILFFKQQLDDIGMIKKYRQTGNRSSEFLVDIFLEYPMRRRISVLAVKKEFWDKIGGIALYERG